MCTQHEQATPGKRGDPPTHQFPEPSLHPVANHRRANRTADYKAYLRLGVLGYRTGGQQQMPGQGRATSPSARAHRALELLRAPHPRLLRQHDPSSKGRSADNLTRPAPPAAKPHREVLGVVPAGDIAGSRHREGDRRSLTPVGPRPAISLSARNQTASCSRPLRRRAARTARPARVRIRSRKPCTFARRRLFGWNVRLLTGTPGRSGNTVLNQGQTCRAPRAPNMAQPVNGTGDPRTGQTEPLPRVKHRDFHNVPTAGDLGCGKSRSAGRLRGAGRSRRDGETALQPTYTPVDEPVDNELRLVIDLVERIAARARLRGEGSHR